MARCCGSSAADARAARRAPRGRLRSVQMVRARSIWTSVAHLAHLAPLASLGCASGTAPPVAPPQSVELPPAPPRPREVATADTATAPPAVPPRAPASAEPAASSRVREPATELGGRLSPSLILGTVKPSLPRIRRCYELALAANPKLTGKVTVSFVIGVDGVTRSVGAGPADFPDPLLLRCVETVISALRFPAPEGGDVHVSYPLVFVPDTPIAASTPSGSAPAPAPSTLTKK